MNHFTTLEEAAREISRDFDVSLENFLAFCSEDDIGGYLGKGDWPTRDCIREPEGKLLYATVRSLQPKTILEFGTSLGCSTSHMEAALQSNKKGTIVTVDINQQRLKLQSPLVVAVASEGIAYSKTIDSPLDFIFHDGPHNKVFTYRLLSNCLPHLRPGGAIFVHDVLHPQFGAEVMEGMRLALGDGTKCALIEPSDAGIGWWRKPLKLPSQETK